MSPNTRIWTGWLLGPPSLLRRACISGTIASPASIAARAISWLVRWRVLGLPTSSVTWIWRGFPLAPTWTYAEWISGNRSLSSSSISQRFAARSVASSAVPAGSSPITLVVSRSPSGTNSVPSC